MSQSALQKRMNQKYRTVRVRHDVYSELKKLLKKYGDISFSEYFAKLIGVPYKEEQKEKQ